MLGSVLLILVILLVIEILIVLFIIIVLVLQQMYRRKLAPDLLTGHPRCLAMRR